MSHSSFLFFFNDTATTEIYTLSLHDALPISVDVGSQFTTRAREPFHADLEELTCKRRCMKLSFPNRFPTSRSGRSEEHTSELQSHVNLVCRLLLEKKKKNKNRITLFNEAHH